MVAVQEFASSLPANGVASPLAPLLPRRILFHPPFKDPPAPSSSISLTPLNASPPFDPPSSRDGDQAVRMHPDLPQHSSTPPMPLQSTPVQRIGAGLANLGKTCFLNSVLQCLTYTSPLAAYLQSGLHRNSCRAAGFCAMCALESHVKQALSISGRVLSPTYLVKNLRCVPRSFQMWRQEDAHEYLRYLIEALQKCCHSLEAYGGVPSKTQKSLIHQIFGGQLRSQVKCTQCSYCSNTYDPFLDLSLEIVRAESLLKALARFTAVEVLDGDNKYRCSRCKTEVRALKQFTIDKAPQVLTVQFKRFSSSGGFGGKIDKKVQFDRTLDLKPFVNGGEDEDFKYSLYGVLVHSGWSTHSGHYYCFVRTGVDMWHVLDDSRVSQVSEKTVLEQKAYILFYIRDVKTPVVPDSNHWEPKTRVVSDSDHPAGREKDFSNGAHLHVNGTSKLNGLCGSKHADQRSRETTCSDNENVHVYEGNVNEHLETGCISGNDSYQLSEIQRKGKQNEVSVHNDGAPAARSKFFEAADFAVPRWSEVEGDDMEGQNLPGETRAHCGYVLDEWDEEYDRGKRKKVRNKTVGKKTLLVENLEVSDYHKKRKKVRHMSAERTTPGNPEVQKELRHIKAESTSLGNSDVPSHGNLFQAVAGSRRTVFSHRLKKYKRRRRAGIRGTIFEC